MDQAYIVDGGIKTKAEVGPSGVQGIKLLQGGGGALRGSGF